MVFSATGGRQPRCSFAPSFRLNANTPLQRTTSLPSPVTPSVSLPSSLMSPAGILLEPFRFNHNPLQSLHQNVQQALATSSSPQIINPAAFEHTPHDEDIDGFCSQSMTPVNDDFLLPKTPDQSNYPPDPSHSDLVGLHQLAATTQATLSQFKGPDTNSGGVFTEFQRHFFRETSKQFEKLLDIFWANPKAKAKFSEWMLPHAVSMVKNCVHDEMEQAKPYFRTSTDEMMPEFLATWNIQNKVSLINMDTPNTLLKPCITNEMV
ncbi:uncharacterized protein EV420DRAFT_1482256 [Desarmillaria tabescens]|uniref:Uncharacterized protein n=1 Tax=Armillaria tabescens TaxID=1929756 RepID=A0AA39K0R5_ARMTA|nr:uncharacterized protein EV420DRAFT_1482256 [Desarmillaria tabescens]KAK0452172.1 hypothetical protein EV420DRAFT_1482256 [Desarmillaria tabescens]